MATIEDYKKAVLARYEEVKNGEFSEFLLQPTPAKLKTLCLLLLDGLNTTDKNIFDIFFKAENTTRECIEDFDNDKLRPLRNFIIGKSNLSRVESINLIAVFVKLNSRPYNKFRNTKASSEEDKTEHEAQDENIITVIDSESSPDFNEPIKNKQQVALALKPNQLQFGLLALIVLALTIALFSDAFKEKGCMVWTKDHYEKVDCDQISTGSKYINFDKVIFEKMKKIKVCDTTTFFNPDRSPRIWYYKIGDGEFQFFSYRGEHPEIKGRDLKRITDYIIKRHVKKCSH